MKHIWQSPQKHTSGSFNVTENVAGLTPAAYQSAIFTLPINDRGKKHISVCRSLNLGNLEKDLSETAGVGSFRRSAAPGQALPLYMNQASLYHDTRPEFLEDHYHLPVAVHGETVGAQASRYQGLKELQQLRLRILGDTILPRHNSMSLGIHQSNKAAGTVQKCPIQDEVPASIQIQGGWWERLLQLTIDHTIQLPRTMVALVCQLSGRITFNDPELKPLLLLSMPSSFTPSKRVSARAAKPTLFSFGIMTVSPENIRAERTEFFCSYYYLRSNQS